MKKKKGFIVHPLETGSGSYDASYNNHNKTVKSFKTLREAKGYLAKKGVTKAVYDTPQGASEIQTQQTTTRRKTKKSKDPFNFNFGF